VHPRGFELVGGLIFGLVLESDGHSCALSKRSILVPLLMWVTAVRTVAEVPGGRAFLPVTFFSQLSVARFHECSDGQEWPSSWGTCSTSVQVELPNTWLFYKAHSWPSLAQIQSSTTNSTSTLSLLSKASVLTL